MAATPVPIDVADQKQVQDRARTAKDKGKERDAALKAFMSHQQGRAWVWDLLEHCRCFHTSFVAGDPHVTSFNEGRRDAGQKVLSQLARVCPDLYAKMTEENSDER